MGPFLLLLGCSTGANYTLSLVPVVPDNQTPFAGLDRIDLVLEMEDGSSQTYTLDTTSGSPELPELPALEGTRVAMYGYSGTELLSFGRSSAISITGGEREKHILVSSLDSLGWLDSLETPLAGGALASVDGVFYLFGGDSERIDIFGNADGTGTSGIYRLNLSDPEGLSFVALEAQMPENNPGVNTWAGQTATSLPDGTILVAGGGEWYAATGDSVLFHAFVFDPETETPGPVFELQVSRGDHKAVRFSNGDVALIGGLLSASSGSDAVEIYRSDVQKTDLGDKLEAFRPAAASLGASGILICGGSRSGDPTDICQVLTVSGALDDAASLPAPRDGLTLSSVGDGMVLAAGGADETLEAQDNAWLYQAEMDSWIAVGGLQSARGLHRAQTLVSGEVLIVGGTTRVERGVPAWDGEFLGEALSCAELFDPVSKTFTSLQGCGLEDDAEGMPARAIVPSVATDPLYGTLIVGGVTGDNDLAPLPWVSYWPAVTAE